MVSDSLLCNAMGRHNDKPLKDVLNEFIISNAKVDKGYHTAQIHDVWNEMMGPVIANYTSRITFNDGVLKIYLTSAALKKEFSMGKEKIIELLNKEIGKAIIKSVEIY
jgi:predicted nucleic acid-binding Zn ribbon protein